MENKFKEITKNLEKNFEDIRENAADFSLEQIKGVQGHLKTLEDAIIKKREQKKVKTLTISADIHAKVKKYCVENEITMSEWVEEVLEMAIIPSEK
jgi:hypothetical protein